MQKKKDFEKPSLSRVDETVKCKNVFSSFILDIDECASTPCQNGGTCTDAVNGYTCACEAGYSGADCSTGKAQF